MVSFLSGNEVISTTGIRVVDPGYPLATATNIPPVDPQIIWKTQPSVRKVVGFIARNVASLPWKAYIRENDTDRQRIADSYLERILRNPRPRQTSFKLMQRLATDMCLYDRWAVVFIDGALQRIPPRLLVIESDPLDNIVRVGLQTTDGVVDVTDQPLAVGTGWSAWSGDGVSPLTTLSEILDEQRRAVNWRRKQWDETPKFTGIIKRPLEAGKWEKGVKERWISDWRTFRDSNAGGTPIFEDGMEYEDLSGRINPVEAQDIQGRQLTDAEVSSAFYIPPELVGARQGTFSNIAAFRQMLFGPALGPIIEEFEQAFNSELIPALDTRDGVYAELDRSSAINGSFLEQAQILSTAIGRPWLVVNEGRATQNYPAIEGGDELVTPLNVLVGGLASPRDTGPQNLRAQDNQKAALKAVAGELLAREKSAAQDRLVDVLKGIYNRQLADQDGSDIDSEAFHEAWDKVLDDALHPHLWQSALAGAKSILARYNPDEDGWAAEVMENWIAEMSKSSAKKINDGVIDQVRSLSSEQTISDLTDKLTNSVALSWAGSLVTEAAGFGRNDAASATGLSRKTWIVTSSNPRPSHAALNGTSVGLDDVFPNGLRYPGDSYGADDEVAGCTCECEYEW